MAGVENMTDIHDIRGPLSGNNTILLLVLFSIALFITFLICGYILFYLDKKYRKILMQKIAKSFEKKVDFKAEAIGQFLNLKTYVERNPGVDQIFTFYKISQILRWYIENVNQNNALKKTKSELEYMKVEDLDKILGICYPVQYAAQVVNPEFSVSIINLSINLIRKWS